MTPGPKDSRLLLWTKTVEKNLFPVFTNIVVQKGVWKHPRACSHLLIAQNNCSFPWPKFLSPSFLLPGVFLSLLPIPSSLSPQPPSTYKHTRPSWLDAVFWSWCDILCELCWLTSWCATLWGIYCLTLFLTCPQLGDGSHTLQLSMQRTQHLLGTQLKSISF